MSLRTRIEAEIGPLTDWLAFRDLLIDVLVEAGYASAAAPIRSVYSPTMHDDPRAIADLIVLVADVTDGGAQNALYSVAHMANAGAANIYRQLLTIADTQLEGVGGEAGPITAMALAQIADDRIFQRAAGTTSAPVTVSGSTTGRATAVEARVLLVADDSVIVNWTTIDGSPNASSFSGQISTPQGGPYYVEVRDTVDTGIGDVGTTEFFVGALIVGYGQSNWLFHMTVTSSPPSANSLTGYFNGTSWASVPVGNGVREMLNFLATDTGIPWGIVSGGASGVSLTALMEGATEGHFSQIAADIAAMGGDVEAIAFLQGENETTAPNPSIWTSNLGVLHQSFCDEVGRTKAQLPLFLSSLGPATGATGTDATWWVQQEAIREAVSLTNVIYSHSNMDGSLSDTIHWDAATYGRSGRRYAQSIADYLGTETTSPPWYISDVEIVDATTTTVTVVHSGGTDFTPTTGITGFDVSDDNGAVWEAATGVRASATTITLTHASLSTTDPRLLRYQYGKAVQTAPVVDNSAIASPLNHSAGQELSADALSGATPVPTWRAADEGARSGAMASFVVSTIGPFAADQLVIMGFSNETNRTWSSGVLKASGGDVAASVSGQGASGSCTLLFQQAVLPAGQTFTTWEVTISSAAFNNPRSNVWTVPVADLNSTTRTDVKFDVDTGATVSTVDLDTDAGGFILAISINSLTTAQSGVVSGDETYAERDDVFLGGSQHLAADASGTSDTGGAATNTVTATYTNAGDMALLAASWR